MNKKELLEFIDYEEKFRDLRIGNYRCDDIVFVFSIMYALNADKRFYIKGLPAKHIEGEIEYADITHCLPWEVVLDEFSRDHDIPYIAWKIVDMSDARKLVYTNIIDKLDFNKPYSIEYLYDMFLESYEPVYFERPKELQNIMQQPISMNH